LRQDNGGLCDPEACAEYQNRQCNLSGHFIFFIPGIKSIGAFELHTNSFYAMNAAIQKFETIAFMRGGRISGFLDGKRTSFFITKKLMDVPHIDGAGRAVRVAHWIIELEAPVDVTTLLRASDDDETALADGSLAARVLEGAWPADEAAADEPHTIETAVDEIPATAGGADLGEGHDRVSARNASRPAAPRTSGALAAEAGPAPSQPRHVGSGPSLEQVLNAAADFGIDAERYERYAAKRWGSGWKINATGRRRALAEIESFRDDPDGLTDKIAAEIEVFP
jgi:hypothetical protein